MSKEFYNKVSDVYDSRFRSPTMELCRKKEAKLFEKHVRGRVIDLGCGTGFWTGQCSAGLDFSRGMLKSAAKRSQNLLLADISEMPVRSGCFDSAILFFSTLGRKDLKRAAPEISRVLKGGGMLLLSLPSVYDSGCSYFEKRKVKKPPRTKVYHVCGHKTSLELFTKPEVERVFSQAGFELVCFDSLFILQKPVWGNWKSFSLLEKLKLKIERCFPKELGCVYFFVFRKK